MYLALLAIACLVLPWVARGETEHGLWKSQQIEMLYRGRITMYDCDVLRHKVQQVLGTIGAHESTEVNTTNCSNLLLSANSSVQVATLHISIVSPARVTPQLRAELARDWSRQELLDRLGAKHVPSEEFPVYWRSVDVAGDERLKLTARDCELLQQLRKQVLPKLAVKVMARDSHCSTSPQRLRAPRLKIMALMPVPSPDAIDNAHLETG